MASVWQINIHSGLLAVNVDASIVLILAEINIVRKLGKCTTETEIHAVIY